MDILSFFVTYLLLPLVGAVSTVIMSLLNKGNRVMNNARMIIAVLVTAVLLGIPGFLGALSFYFMPWGFLFGILICLGLGTLAVYQLSVRYPDGLTSGKVLTFFMGLVACLLGAYLFRLLFDWLNPLGYGWFAASVTLSFLVPLVFWWTYVSMASIPSEIYTVWYYPSGETWIDLDHLDFDRMKVLEIELFKFPEDVTPLKVKVKAPPNMQFGTWYKKFIDDYNQKFPAAGIRYAAGGAAPYGWIFYIKKNFFRRKRFIDPALSLEENGVNEKAPIFARRVVRVTTESGGEDRMVIL